MSSGNPYELIFKQQATIGKLVIDGKRDPARVADVLQTIISEPAANSTTEKFAPFVNLGILTVPKGYDHATRLASFKKSNRGNFYSYNDVITDENFSKPTRILTPGDKFWVQAFRQTAPGTTTSIERMKFLEKQRVVHLGAQGASLVFEQKRDQLPKGYWYASFDEKKRLWRGADGRCRVPFVFARSSGGFDFDLGHFGYPWFSDNAFLGFRDLESLVAEILSQRLGS